MLLRYAGEALHFISTSTQKSVHGCSADLFNDLYLESLVMEFSSIQLHSLHAESAANLKHQVNP